jgi:hypothetical protein
LAWTGTCDLCIWLKVKKKSRIWRPIELWDLDTTLSTQLAVKLSIFYVGHTFLPRNFFFSVSGTPFCWRLSRPQALVRLEGLGKLKKIIDFIRTQTPYNHFKITCINNWNHYLLPCYQYISGFYHSLWRRDCSKCFSGKCFIILVVYKSVNVMLRMLGIHYQWTENNLCTMLLH